MVTRTTLLLLLCLLLAPTPYAGAATYSVATTGSDGNAGSLAAPWLTFAHALSVLAAGDTLLVQDGIYTMGTHGALNIVCGSNAAQGTAGAPITIAAQHERQALLQGDGSARPVHMLNCSYWTLEGLRAEDGDFSGESAGDEPGSVVVVKNSDHITLRRMLVRFDNRYNNTAGYGLRVYNSLIEENELYSFHRHGFQLYGGDNNVFRRNYANSRARADITGGYGSANGDFSTGDGAFITYGTPDATGNIFENNISEGNGEGFYSNAFYANAIDTRVLGHISLNDARGVFANSGDTGTVTANLQIQDYVAINTSSIGFLMGSIRNACTNCTAIGGTGTDPAFLAYKITSAPGDGVYSFAGTNLLAVNNANSTGISITTDVQTWTVNGSNSYGNATAYAPSSSPNYTNKRAQDPQLGTCLAWIPASSPMKGVGAGGSDIGANILTRYQNGVLTSVPLWDPATGAFPCGVVVAGVNDQAGSSCANVHLRLNINTNGCAFPDGYTSGLPALTPGTWYQVPSSHLRDAVKPASSYPDYSGGSSATYNAINGADGPPGLMSAWSGASWDSMRDRLYVWGGGHGDYAGNEVYAFDLSTLAWIRLTDPYTRVDAAGTVESSGEYPDSGGTPLPTQPRAVHTYNYVQYVPAIDRFCSLGVGPTYSQALPGSSTNKVHCFNPTTNTWALQASRVVSSGGFAVTGGYSAIDTSTGHVFLHSTISNTGLWEWNASTDTWTRRTASGDGTGQFTFSRTAAIDPTRHWFVAVGVGESGNGTELLDLTASPVVTQAITTTGDKTLESKQAPGFVWDSVLGKFVGWAGGADVYTLDPATWIWTKVMPDDSNTVIPTSPAANGTYGRFAYIASQRLYGVVNDIDQSVYIYKPFAAASTALTSVALTSTSTGTKPFSVGLGFTKGDIASGSVPTLDIPDYQVEVKRVWNDGSVKHAVVSGAVALTANTPRMLHVAAGSAPTGTALTCANIATANPSASVQAAGIGTVTLSSLLASPVRTWLAGPQMVECHYYHLIGADTTLGVWFHVRLFAGGVTWIRALVENGFLDISTSTKTYVPTITLYGVSVYANFGNPITHYPHTRYSGERWSTDPAVTVAHDMTYLMASKLVPNYALGAPTGADLNSLTQTYTALSTGNWSPNMGDTGYQPQIGLLPQWDAMLATSGADARAWRSTQANAKALSTYPIVWRSSSTHLPVRPSAFSTWTVDGAGQGGETQVCASSTCFDVAHHGSGGYLAYLLTGEYAHLETLQFVASMGYLMNTSGNGSGTARLLTGQTRAVAWILRSLGQLAGIGALDTVTTDYQTLLATQATHWQTLIDIPGVNPLGYLYSYELASGGYGPGQVAPWQQHFWVQTMGAVSDLEPLATMTTWNSVRDWLYRSAVGILGPNGSSTYCFTSGGAFNLTISQNGTNQDPTLWETSWGNVWFDTFAIANTSCANTLTGGSGSDPLNAATGYWGNLLPAIAYATEHGATGASASWTRLTGATNWAAVLGSGFGAAPQFGIVPRSVPLAPVLTVPIFHKH